MFSILELKKFFVLLWGSVFARSSRNFLAEMEESTADATEANADTLRLELRKMLTEIFEDRLVGEESEDFGETDGRIGILKAIDEAIRILTCLKIAESKKMESAISSSSPLPLDSVEVPKEFRCYLSKKIMIEPVVITSGQTYEKRSIKEWLRYQRICPKTDEIISNCLCIPNHLINELITEWCQLNNFDRPKPNEEILNDMFTDGLDSLLQRISSSSSFEDQTEAAKELRHRTKKFPNVREFFVTQLPDSITRLLTPLNNLGEEVDSYPQLQENVVTILFNISTFEKNKTVIAENSYVIPLLTKSLKKGTAATRRNSAATLSSLSIIDSNKIIIGKLETLKALIDLIREGDILAINEAASAMFNLCILSKNKDKAILAGLVPVATDKIKAGRNVDELVTLLALICTQVKATEEMENLGFIKDLLSIMREEGCSITGENALIIVFNMCERSRGKSIIKAVAEEEKKNGTFMKFAEQGTGRAVRKAESILMRLKRFVCGKEIMMA